MQLGICTFADLALDSSGNPVNTQQRMKDLLEEITLADQVGLDVFGLGEHHRPDYAVSAPAVVLGAAAAITSRIRLTSAVTVLSSDDPVRVFQDFATIDLLSGGRAEIMAGRGSFIESFPLFGQDLNDYDELFSEKLDLLLQLRDRETISWNGRHRAAISDRGVYPRPVQQPLPVWIAVGGTVESVIRAATLGLPIAFAIIGGAWRQFSQLVDLYRRTAKRAGHDLTTMPVAINAHGFLGEDDQSAADTFYPPYAEVMTRIGRERRWPPTNRGQFEAGRSLEGALLVGDAQQVIEKILAQHEVFRHERFLMQMGVGAVPHRELLRSIEIFGSQVAPAVRKAVIENRE